MAKIYEFSGDKVTEKEPELKEVIPGVKSGMIYVDPEKGISVGESCIAANGVLPPHKGATDGVFIVVKGSGFVYTYGEDGGVIDKTAVSAGDFLHYTQPYYNHSYEAGPDGLAYAVVPIPAK